MTETVREGSVKLAGGVRQAYNAGQRQNWANAGALLDSAALKAADRARHGFLAPVFPPRFPDGWQHISALIECDIAHAPLCSCAAFRHGVPLTPEEFVGV